MTKYNLFHVKSGRRDLNPRSPAPEAGAIPSFATTRRLRRCDKNGFIARCYSERKRGASCAPSSRTRRSTKLSHSPKSFRAQQLVGYFAYFRAAGKKFRWQNLAFVGRLD